GRTGTLRAKSSADPVSEEPMAEEKKKSKIDLKARLGKTAMTSAGQAAVPVPAPGAQVPAPAGAPTPAPPAQPGSGAAAPDASPVQGRPPSQPAPAMGSSPPVAAYTPPPIAAGIAPPPAIAQGISPGIPLPPFATQPRPQQPPPKAAAQTIKVEVSEEIH